MDQLLVFTMLIHPSTHVCYELVPDFWRPRAKTSASLKTKALLGTSSTKMLQHTGPGARLPDVFPETQ